MHALEKSEDVDTSKFAFKVGEQVTVTRGYWRGIKARIVALPPYLENGKPLGKYECISDYGDSDVDLYALECDIVPRTSGQCGQCKFWKYDYLRDICKNPFAHQFRKETKETDGCDSLVPKSYDDNSD